MAKELKDLMNMSDEELAGTIDFGSPEDTSAPDEEEIIEENNDNQEDDKEVVEGEGEADDADDDSDDDDTDDESSSGSDDAEPDDDKSGTADDKDQSKGKGKPEDVPAKAGDEAKGKPKADPKADAKAVPEGKAKDNQVAPDYEKLYKEIMKPFKANGREIKLENPEEAVKLMQMGANYTKKMQAIQPNLKILRMLENNQLLDESKLNQLIDISKGDKSAIAKIVKDSGIDPMDIDTSDEVTYKPGNHSVSDSEINFASTVEDISTTDHGQELIIQMNHQWDQTSKQEIFKAPELIRVLAEQKANGIYDTIASEVEKQKVLGHPQIASLPFIHAYKVVGDALQKQGLLVPRGVQQGAATTPQDTQTTPTELGRGTAPAKKTVTNDEKAKSASPSAKSSKKAATPSFNPLSMSDEEFLSQMQNRV